MVVAKKKGLGMWYLPWCDIFDEQVDCVESKYLELINGFDKLFAEEDKRAIQILGKYGDESVFLGFVEWL